MSGFAVVTLTIHHETIMKLWVDDEREAPEGWHHAKTYLEAIACITLAVGNQTLEAVSLDHDLGEQATGYDVACVLEKLAAEGELDWFRGELGCHSANPVGRHRVESALRAVRSFIGY